jgi:hypothetical protein
VHKVEKEQRYAKRRGPGCDLGRKELWFTVLASSVRACDRATDSRHPSPIKTAAKSSS